MPWEYWLFPTNAAKRFGEEALEQMRARIRAMPVAHKIDKDEFLIFATAEELKERAPFIGTVDSATYEIFAAIELRDEEILMTAVGDPEAEEHLRELARWILSQWPCVLRYAGEVITPDRLGTRPRR